jgi:crotonobetainyl-CoA:carnitine CoA-transferase CaiB-like acyl-CoA transferase
MAINGDPNGDPMKTGVALADVIAGKDAAIAILGALVGRFRTGVGKRVRISLVDSARAALVNVAQNALISGREPARWGNAHPNIVPYQLFRTADKPIVVAVGSDAQWVACARAIGLTRLADEPSLATNTGRVAQRERILAAFSDQLVTRPAAAWRDTLDAAGIPNGVVKSVLEALQDTNASAVTGMPSSVGGRVRFSPPGLDEHGGAIRSAGWAAFGAVRPWRG